MELNFGLLHPLVVSMFYPQSKLKFLLHAYLPLFLAAFFFLLQLKYGKFFLNRPNMSMYPRNDQPKTLKTIELMQSVWSRKCASPC